MRRNVFMEYWFNAFGEFDVVSETRVFIRIATIHEVDDNYSPDASISDMTSFAALV